MSDLTVQKKYVVLSKDKIFNIWSDSGLPWCNKKAMQAVVDALNTWSQENNANMQFKLAFRLTSYDTTEEDECSVSLPKGVTA